MRVALVCLDRGVPLGGPKGASVHLRAVAGALLGAGHTVDAIVRTEGTGADVAALRTAGLAVTALPGPADPDTLATRFARTRPALVLERLALGADAGALAAAACGVPHVYEVNAPLDREAERWRGLTDPEAARACLARGFAASGGSVAVSDEVAHWVRSLAPSDHAVRVEPNGVDPMFLEPPTAAALARATAALGVRRGFRVAFWGTFRPWHDLEGLIAAAALAGVTPPLELVLVGDGPGRERLAALAAGRGVPLVMTGTVPHIDVPAHLALCDAAAIPCAAPDAWFSPLKLIEAMAAALPLVASATGPVSRLVRHGVDGLLVPPGDVPAMARALAVLARDPARGGRLGAAARAAVRAERTWDAVVERVVDFGLARAERAS